MRRREFMAGIRGIAVAYPMVGGAQQPIMPTLGVLTSHSAASVKAYLGAMREGLAEAGFAEGRNLAIEYRWAEGHYERLPALASELVNRNVAVIVATGAVVSARAAKAATSSIPIVFVVGGDPITFRLVESLNRPSGNITGVTMFAYQLDAKRLELVAGGCAWCVRRCHAHKSDERSV
jgi:putative tryptophan/tyrosine transport system substrate-binding protein